MPQMELPTSKFLTVAQWKKALSKAKTEAERVCFIIEVPTESKTNKEMLSCLVHSSLIGDKELYDFKNKFTDFFESYGANTDEWLGKMLVPVVPTTDTLFFTRFETKAALEENIAE